MIENLIASHNEILSADAIMYYRDEPVDFIEDNFIAPASRFKPGLFISKQQKDGLRELVKSNRVGIESGHGCGKSTMLSWIAYWFLFTRHTPGIDLTKIRAMANSYGQLYDVLWPELKRWLSMSRLGSLIEVGELQISIPVFENGKTNKDHSYIKAFTPNNTDSLVGAHAAHLLWIVDESFSIKDPMVWETLEGSMTEDDNKVIFAGQHNTMVGYCHDAFHKDKERCGWSTLRFNSMDSPFVKMDYVDHLRRKFGEKHDVFRVRVLGMEPSGNSEAFLPYEKVELARLRKIDKPSGAIELGVDCARFGDDLTVITSRWGLKFSPQIFLSKLDSFDVTTAVLEEVRRMRAISKYAGVIRIKIDATGGHGSGVIDMLKKNTEDNIEIVTIVYSSGKGDDIYTNITSRMWGELLEHIDGMELPDEDNLCEELFSRKKKFVDGKICIQDKKSFKKEYHASPDRSDSLCLCLTGIQPIERVFPLYVETSWDCHRRVVVDWGNIDPTRYEVYGAISYHGNTMYGSLFLYDALTEDLRLYNEFVMPNPTTELIIKELQSKAIVPMKASAGLYVSAIYAGSLSFKGANDISYQMRKAGCRLKEAQRFDRPGAILKVNGLFSAGKMVVSTTCQESNAQLNSWAIAANGSPEGGACLGENILIVVSELRKRAEEREVEAPKTSGYSKDKSSTKDKIMKTNKAAGPMAKTGNEWLGK